MAECRIHIVLLGSSPVVGEGLSAVLMQSRKHYVIHRVSGLAGLDKLDELDLVQVVLANPQALRGREEDFSHMQFRIPSATWIGISSDDTVLLPEGLSGSISIHDTTAQITSKVEGFVSGCSCHSQDSGELTEREIDVLVLLVQGYSNKDVAEKLFISPHTVITHRKNLVEKTGIRSLSGLTIYAITKNIISLDSLSSR